MTAGYGEARMIRLDGTGDTDNDSYPFNMHVIGDWIYYLNYWDGHKLYKRKIDNTQVIKLTQERASFIGVDNGWIYFNQEKSDGSKLGIFKTKTDESNIININNTKGFLGRYMNGWIYGDLKLNKPREVLPVPKTPPFYIVEEDYKIRIDGTELTKESYDKSKESIVRLTDEFSTDDWIYFSNKSDGSKLYKVKKDGSMITKMNDFDSSDIRVIGDWVYYNMFEHR